MTHDLPAGYQLRRRAPLAPSTARRPLDRAWLKALAEIGWDGQWRSWGKGHTTSPITNALHRRGLIDVADSTASGRRCLYRTTTEGRALEGR